MSDAPHRRHDADSTHIPADLDLESLDLDVEAIGEILDDPDLAELLWSFETDGSRRDEAPRHLDMAAGHPSAETRAREFELERPVGPRPSPTLTHTWLDSEDAPFTPQKRPGKAWASRIFAWVVVAAIVAFLAWLVVPELEFRYLHRGEARYSDGILTAQPVPLSTIRPSIVQELFVSATSLPDEVIPAGTPLARVSSLNVRGTAIEETDLVSPFDARFVSVDAPVGAVTQPGSPVVTLYDPADMIVIVTVNTDDLNRLRRGMSATLHNDELPAPIMGVVDSAVPLLGTDHEPTSTRLVNVRIRLDTDAVADLVPGIRFHVRVDTRSVGDEAPALVYTSGSVPDGETDGAVDGD